MDRRAKFNTASFILGGEIRNHKTNKHTHTHTHKTVANIFTPCLSACVDNWGVTADPDRIQCHDSVTEE